MRNFIVKFIPLKDDAQPVIHKIAMPDYGDKGFYRDTESWNCFQSGKKNGLTKEDRNMQRTACCWSPTGLYYTHDHNEEEWLRKIAFRIEQNRKRTDRTESELKFIEQAIDERTYPTVQHTSIWEFYRFIGFDHKSRKYKVTDANIASSK